MNKNIIVIFIIIILGCVLAYWLFGGFDKKPQFSSIQPSNGGNQPEATLSPTSTPKNNINNNEQMKIETLKEGSGPGAKNGDKVSVNYVGTLENGTKFDSSIDRGTPFPFTLGAGQVIKGWDMGVLGMKVGEKRKLTIPANLAYGENSPSPLIPANSTLIFEIDLLKIN